MGPICLGLVKALLATQKAKKWFSVPLHALPPGETRGAFVRPRGQCKILLVIIGEIIQRKLVFFGKHQGCIRKRRAEIVPVAMVQSRPCNGHRPCEISLHPRGQMVDEDRAPCLNEIHLQRIIMLKNIYRKSKKNKKRTNYYVPSMDKPPVKKVLRGNMLPWSVSRPFRENRGPAKQSVLSIYEARPDTYLGRVSPASGHTLELFR